MGWATKQSTPCFFCKKAFVRMRWVTSLGKIWTVTPTSNIWRVCWCFPLPCPTRYWRKPVSCQQFLRRGWMRGSMWIVESFHVVVWANTQNRQLEKGNNSLRVTTCFLSEQIELTNQVWQNYQKKQSVARCTVLVTKSITPRIRFSHRPGLGVLPL